MTKTQSDFIREHLYEKFDIKPPQKFKPTYNEEDFLGAMPEEKPITSAEIAKRVGCSHPTVGVYMSKLVEQDKAKRIEIVGGRDAVWEKVV